MKADTQRLIETMYSKHQTMDLLRNEFEKEPFIGELILKSGLEAEFCMALFCQMALHKRASVETLVGVMAPHGDSLQAVADMLFVAAQHDLVDYAPATSQFIVKWIPEPKVYELISKYQFLPPMIVEPLEVTSNRGRGHLTLLKESLILKKNHHEGDICLDVINLKNQIPLQINVDVVMSIRNSWKNLNKCKPGETFEEFQKRVESFERFERQTMKDMALMVNNDNEFWLTHAVCKRGRQYCGGYTINYQGNDYQKSVVELKREEIVEGF